MPVVCGGGVPDLTLPPPFLSSVCVLEGSPPLLCRGSGPPLNHPQRLYVELPVGICRHEKRSTPISCTWRKREKKRYKLLQHLNEHPIYLLPRGPSGHILSGGPCMGRQQSSNPHQGLVEGKLGHRPLVAMLIHVGAHRYIKPEGASLDRSRPWGPVWLLPSPPAWPLAWALASEVPVYLNSDLLAPLPSPSPSSPTPTSTLQWEEGGVWPVALSTLYPYLSIELCTCDYRTHDHCAPFHMPNDFCRYDN
ncbi:hypothetical protein JZ751_014989 [Albula glossodonta]|uniref:Uncharacterized protein n=1 Tax=Albula glossodonta TaxID=121402 RepID=A0A8T2N1V6_9TELE|nr:hypothetical protein JZ751_014989 [Albula glossodonta]